MIRLPAPGRPYPQVWTDRWVAAWRSEGQRRAVAVWTADRLAHFLAFARGDRLYPLWQLIALRGLRRGEAIGLRWVDLDLDRRELTVSRQLVHVDGQLIECPRKVQPAVGSSRWTARRSDCCAATSRPRGDTWAMRGSSQGRSSPGPTDLRCGRTISASDSANGCTPAGCHRSVTRPAPWHRKSCPGHRGGSAGGAGHARARQHRRDLRHLHLRVAGGVSPVRAGHREAGHGQGSRDRPGGPEDRGLAA